MADNAQELQFRELLDAMKELQTVIESLRKELAAKTKELQDQQEKYAREKKATDEQIEYLMKKLYGKSSEKHDFNSDGQLSFFDEAEAEAPKATEPELDPEEETPVTVRKRKPKTVKEQLLKDIHVEEVLITLPTEERICAVCGSEMISAGRKFVRDEWHFIPARLEVKRYYQETYFCPECKKNGDKSNLINAPVPEALIPHSMASETVVAHAMYQKYANAVPFYRQEKDWKQQGAVLNRARLAKWTITCSEQYFTPVYDYFRRQMLKRSFLMADETRIQVLDEPERKPTTDSFMWLFRTGEDGLPPIILYGYTETRAKRNAVSFLDGFSGYLMTDGYQGYNDLPGITRTCCWAHVRRYFNDAVPQKKKMDYSDPALQGVIYCDKLFAVERHCSEHGFSAKQRYNYRLQHSKPLIDAFWKWVDIQKERQDANSMIGRAITYALNRKPYLATYLEDGRCSFSNNASENSIRPFCVGRRNWLFNETPAGATASATVYTMVEMAKAHGLNVESYLTFLLKNRPHQGMSDEEFENLAPWSKAAREFCGDSVAE